jgi:hypothetical protein
LYTPEADVEYLIRTLSEARSRATELADSIGSRLGAEHPLTQLANAGASNIENALREVRSSAAVHDPPDIAPFAAPAGLDPEHWLHAFMDQLLAQARTPGGISFESAERLLQQHKDEFLRDFLIARRMYRTYPQLFPEIASEARQAGSP